MSTPVIVALSLRGVSYERPGTDRQPSPPSCGSSPTLSRGLTTWPSSPWMPHVKTCSPTPTWGAARPTPPTAYMVSSMSRTSVRRDSSNSATSWAGVRSTGSPMVRMRRILTV